MDEMVVDEEMLKFAYENQREKEVVLKKVKEMEAKLDKKQALELRIVEIKGKVEVIKLITAYEGNIGANKPLEALEEQLAGMPIWKRCKLLEKEVMAEFEAMHQSYNEEMKKIQDTASYKLRKICEEHERSNTELDARRNELKFREEELIEKKNLDQNLKKMEDRLCNVCGCWFVQNEMIILEQEKADEEMLKLANEQRKEKEVLCKKIIQLEAQLDQKQSLKLQIERMRAAFEVMKHMTHEGDIDNMILELKSKL